MNNELILRQIEKMDKTTDEFAALFYKINDKFFDFDSPDSFQQSAKLLNLILHSGEEWQIEILVRLYEQLLKLSQKGGGITAQFNVAGKDYFVQMYDDPKEIDKLAKVLTNTIIVKAKEQ